MSKTGKTLLKGGIARASERVVGAVIGLLLMPYIIHSLGDRMYGAWVIVGTLVGYYGLLDLGLSSAVRRFVALELGREDKNEVDGFIATSFYAFCLLGLAVCGVTALAAWLVQYFVNDHAEVLLFRQLIIITGLTLALSFPSKSFAGTLTAYLRYDLISLSNMALSMVRAVLVLLVLSKGGGILSLALVNSVATLTEAIMFAVLSRHVHGYCRLNPTLVTKRKFADLTNYAKYTFVIQITDLLRFKADPFIITFFLGLAAVTPYAVAFRLLMFIRQLCSAMLSLLTPFFSQLEGREDVEGIRSSYFFSYKVSCYAGTFLIGLLVVCGADFINRWLGGEMEQVATLMYVGAIGFLFEVIQLPTANLLYGLGKNRLFMAVNLAQSVITILLSAVLINIYGLYGVLFSFSIVSFLIKNFVLCYGACKYFDLTINTYHLQFTLPNLLKPAFFVLVLALASLSMDLGSYSRLILFSGLSTILFTGYIFYSGFLKRERDLILSSIK